MPLTEEMNVDRALATIEKEGEELANEEGLWSQTLYSMANAHQQGVASLAQ